MFEHQTTIVLGAGASASYGYPLGSGLVEEIINRFDFSAATPRNRVIMNRPCQG